MEDRKIRVAITHGDTNGIGYEVILKAFEDPAMLELCTPIIYGSPKVAAYHRKALDLEVPFSIINSADEAHENRLNMLATFDEEVKVDLGQSTEESADAARKAMARAKEDLQKGLYDVLVLGPVKSAASPQKEDKPLTMMVGDAVRIGLVTSRLPIKEVAQAITTEKIMDKGRIFHTSLNEGIQAFGPFLADEFFGEGLYHSFDGVLAMYDDQGIVPFKTLAHEYGVKLKAGITAICTTPDHGPAFDIAGKGVADASSMRHAIYMAVDMFRHRVDYDEPLANPLPKLYHEKREDGDKARFAVKSKELPKKAPASADDAPKE